MRVNFGWIDGHGILESLNSFDILMALLVNESELILRFTIVRVHGRSLQHPTKALAAPQAGAQFAELGAEIVIRVEQEERGGEPSQQKPERPPKDNHCHYRNPRQAHHDDRGPVPDPEYRSHCEEYQNQEIQVCQSGENHDDWRCKYPAGHR